MRTGKCQTCAYWSDTCEDINTRKKQLHGTRDTLCWCCKHAVPGENKGCEWSMYRVPVPGWNVDQSGLHRLSNGKLVHTYRVVSCPKFERG